MHFYLVVTGPPPNAGLFYEEDEIFQITFWSQQSGAHRRCTNDCTPVAHRSTSVKIKCWMLCILFKLLDNLWRFFIRKVSIIFAWMVYSSIFTISRKVFKIIQKHSYAFKYIPFFIHSYELWYCLVSQRLFDPPTVMHRRMKFVVDSNCQDENEQEGQIFHE